MAGGAAAGFVSGAIMTGSLKGALKGAFIGAATAGVFEGVAQYGFGTSTVGDVAQKMKLRELGVSEENIALLYGEKVADPTPVIDRNYVVDQGLGLEVKNGKIVGDVGVRCNGTQCSSVVNKMNTISEVNEMIDVKFSLATDASHDMSIEFYSEGFKNGELTNGKWVKSSKTLRLNTKYSISHDVINHETGHAF